MKLRTVLRDEIGLDIIRRLLLKPEAEPTHDTTAHALVVVRGGGLVLRLPCPEHVSRIPWARDGRHLAGF